MDMYVLVTFGLGLFIWGLVIGIKRIRLYRKGERIKGKIVDIREIEEPILQTWNYEEKVILYKPVVKIEYKKEEMTFFFDEEIDIKKYKIGDYLEVIYDGEEKDLFLDSKLDFFKFPIFLIILAVLFFSVSITIGLIK